MPMRAVSEKNSSCIAAISKVHFVDITLVLVLETTKIQASFYILQQIHHIYNGSRRITITYVTKVILYKNHSIIKFNPPTAVLQKCRKTQKEALLARELLNLTLPAAIKCNCEIPNRFIILRAFKKIQ
jgi:hypothetical protein